VSDQPVPDNRAYAHQHHVRRHTDISQTLSWLSAGSLPHNRRSHANHQLAWKIADHLRCCHAVRNVGFRRLIPEMIAVHGLLHRGQP
jgi:hypothetical protein